jgi:YidC/Oxa1 family membrane protein insertase
MKRRFLRAASLLLLLAGPGAALAATTVNTSHLRLTFDAGGNLSTAVACFPACIGETVRIQQFADTAVVTVGQGEDGPVSVSQNREGGQYQLRFRQSDGASHTWRIPDTGYRIELETSGGTEVTLHSGEPFRPRPAAGFGNWLEQARYLTINDGDVTQIGLDEESSDATIAEGWIGYRNRYWTLMAQPPGAVDARLAGGAERQDAELQVTVSSGGSWWLYLGPVEPVVLKSADPALQKVMYAGLWFWLRWICLGLFHLLAAIQQFIPAWGIAIMALSLAVNVLMLPLSRIADRFQQQVNETEARLAPELHRIKKNFRGEEQAAKILALYKTERVHPLYSLKSLVGVAVVIPVFIGAFDMLAENIHLLNTGFLWIADLSRPDDLFNLPFRLPFFGSELNLLPFLMTGLSFIASMLHKPLALNAELRRRQVRNMVLLALAFFVLFYTFPAGMVLYWTTNNLISVIKSLWASR